MAETSENFSGIESAAVLRWQVRKNLLRNLAIWTARVAIPIGNLLLIITLLTKVETILMGAITIGALAITTFGGLALVAPGGFFETVKLYSGLDPEKDDRCVFVCSWSFEDRRLSVGSPRHSSDFRRTIPPRDLIAELDEALQRQGRVFLVLNEQARSTAPRDYFVEPNTIDVVDNTGAWLTTFHRLAEASRAIFIFPLLTDGVIEELRLLKEHGLLSKCMIVMPPAVHVLGQMEDERIWMRDRWHEVRSQSPGLRLPEYDPHGMVYVPSPDFSVGLAMSLDGCMNSIVEALDELLPSKGFRNLPICQAIAELTEIGFRWRDRDKRVLERPPIARSR